MLLCSQHFAERERERWEWTSAIELDDALQFDNKSEVTFGDSVMDYKNAIPGLKPVWFKQQRQNPVSLI